ncbi:MULTISPECIES: cyclic nucleotide-binding domain-containing protein [unclassified Acidovorax]|jgi:CRP-like cAMP-binding protein|uniref:Crp/Fnr family transcriptional regulator n=1 Tax=unclassified Acidovorax TaxID=2684926 RepID=UPI000463D6FF|nr:MULTISPECIES: cyclic nucleotide-binding domain-containing protein [unclassified Acidovorax]MCL5742166.1 cyclic nucleotide-binding domain-containing protein [Betaproteobacteria bacterium]OYX12761.1 MAG: Crp/Fnr family transcriptional regulator [Acidovorax sp. 32-64-7]OZA57380.1 MAG: Crp/Fnr family transcriptional regulator [Acidovorax sp. 17-64-282]HQS19849.1 cyclic nucleotide-binding domain-containing protein [Acidovorax defluvii]MBP8224960.1 cyclic nucleotide-binding domain-containing prot
MNAITPIASKIDLTGLLSAIAQADADDSMSNPLTPAQWDTVSAYLQPYAVPAGHVLFSQGATDRTLYLVESGSLSVHYQDEKERLRLAIVGPGSVVGEGAFFSMRPRSATVQASAPTKLWTLTALRFTELTNRQPAIALGLAMAAGAVLAKRLGNRRRRVAAT